MQGAERGGESLHPQPTPVLFHVGRSFLPWFCVTREKLHSVKETTIETFSPLRVVDIA